MVPRPGLPPCPVRQRFGVTLAHCMANYFLFLHQLAGAKNKSLQHESPPGTCHTNVKPSACFTLVEWSPPPPPPPLLLPVQFPKETGLWWVGDSISAAAGQAGLLAWFVLACIPLARARLLDLPPKPIYFAALPTVFPFPVYPFHAALLTVPSVDAPPSNACGYVTRPGSGCPPLSRAE